MGFLDLILKMTCYNEKSSKGYLTITVIRIFQMKEEREKLNHQCDSSAQLRTMLGKIFEAFYKILLLGSIEAIKKSLKLNFNISFLSSINY